MKIYAKNNMLDRMSNLLLKYMPERISDNILIYIFLGGIVKIIWK